MADAAPLVASLPIAPGQVLEERYVVGEVLGEGGMGIVCGGTHVLLGTPVAIKLIHSELKRDPETIQRFMNEARAAAALKSEHIARVFDVGLLPSGEPYLVMEQLDGIGLDQYLSEQGPLPQTEAVDIVLQACEGLAEAHAARLVHRDIKPGNLFLARQASGQLCVKILDFGIAKQQRLDDDTPGLTNPGKSLGSPWYMSPEQMLTPASVDERADVWSLGVLLFELLTGKRPFDGETVPQVCALVLTAPAPAVSEQRAGVDPELERIVLGCLEKEPERRFASVSELAQALTRFGSIPSHAPGIAGTPGSLAPLSGGASGRPRRGSSYGRLAVALLVLPLLALGGWLALRESGVSRKVAAVSRLELPWQARLQPGPAEMELERDVEVPRLEPVRHTGQALAEPERQPSPEEVRSFLEEQRAERAVRYEEWLRAQGLTRLRDAAPESVDEATPAPPPDESMPSSPPPTEE